MTKEDDGLDLLVEKLALEGVNGVKPLLPEPRFGQDVALVAFVIDSCRKAVEARDRTLQQVMQVLGPEVPQGVDYTRADNLSGLIYEVNEALRLLRAAGVQYQTRKRGVANNGAKDPFGDA